MMMFEDTEISITNGLDGYNGDIKEMVLSM